MSIAGVISNYVRLFGELHHRFIPEAPMMPIYFKGINGSFYDY